MKKIILYSAAALAGLMLGGIAKEVSATSTTGLVPLYRLYNPNSGEHFYTTSYYEATTDYDAGWNIEGIGWQTPSSGDPVYRLFNPNSRDAGSHYYTMSAYEASQLQSLGWVWENNQKAFFYSGGSTAVYVDYNPNDGGHNYTTSRFEADSLVKAGWKYDALAMHAAGEGSQDGAKIHPTETATPSRSTAAPRHVDIGSSDIPDASYRTLYPINAWPIEDQTSIPAGSPTAVYKGTVSVKDAYSQDGGAKYALTTVGGTKAGLVGVGFQHVANANDKEFAGGQVSMLLINYKPGVTNGGQYYVTISDGVNQTGTNDFEIDYYAESQTAVYKLNGKVVTALKTQINFNQLYSFQTAFADASDSFTASAFGDSKSWKGTRNPVDFRN
ncbi:MAG: hypothetical protein LBV19_11135 [Streptococcaceae bacterium]|jgi:hypothetical protein|nr:hypothetical protein [Streptococcaceae bacterium]